MVPYQVQIRAYDGAGQSAYCYATFVFRDTPSLTWNLIGTAIDPCSSGSSLIDTETVNWGDNIIGSTTTENTYSVSFINTLEASQNDLKMTVVLERIANLLFTEEVEIRCQILVNSPSNGNSGYIIYDRTIIGPGDSNDTLTVSLDNDIFPQGYTSNVKVILDIVAPVSPGPLSPKPTAKYEIRFCDPS